MAERDLTAGPYGVFLARGENKPVRWVSWIMIWSSRAGQGIRLFLVRLAWRFDEIYDMIVYW